MIRLLSNNDYDISMNYILRNEIETTFLYGNIVEFGLENDKSKRRCGNYYGYFEDGELKGILVFYNLGSCISHYEIDSAISYFSDLMKNYSFEYLIGMKKIVEPLYNNVSQYKTIIEINDSMYLTNKIFKPYNVENLEFVDAVKNISDEAVDFILESKLKGFNQTAAKEEMKGYLSQRGMEEDYILAKSGGRIVSGACIQTFTPTINQIGAVYTKEEERGKGYAKAVVSELCRKITARGKVPTLSVRKNNTPAVKAYTALGFGPHDDYLSIRFEV